MKNEEVYYSLTVKGLLATYLIQSGICTSEEIFTNPVKFDKFYTLLKEYFNRQDTEIEKLLIFADPDNGELVMQKVLGLENRNKN